MKKLLLSSILAMFMVAVSGCESAEIYPHDYIGVYDTKTRQQIEIGMSKEDVEKILGRAENEEEAEDESKIGYGYYDYVDDESDAYTLIIRYDENNNVDNIQYRNDGVIFYGLSPSDKEYTSERYELPDDIGFTSIVTDFIELYDNVYNTNKNAISMFLQKKNDNYVTLDINEIKKMQDKLNDESNDEEVHDLELYVISIYYYSYDNIIAFNFETIDPLYLKDFEIDSLSEVK